MTDSRRTQTTSFWSDGGSSAPIGLLAPGTDLAERYEIRSVLGHGGFAVAYLAHDRDLDRGLPGELAWRVHRPILVERLARFEIARESAP